MADLEKVQVIVFRYAPELQILVLKRIPSKGGVWQPVTGAAEDEDEDLLESVFRELVEETGIAEERALSIIPDLYSYEFEEGRGHARETAFGVEVAPDTTVTLDNNIYQEHDEQRWVSPEEAIELVHWPGQKEAIKKLLEALSLIG